MQKCKVLYGTSVDARAGIQKMGFEHVSMRLNEIERDWTRLNEFELDWTNLTELMSAYI